jgi:hypothetical protein
VLKLHYLLCGSSDEDFENSTSRGIDAVERFEDLMSYVGYPQGRVVVTYDSEGNLLPFDEKCKLATVEDVVVYLECSQGIFGSRSWSPDWPLERVQSELRIRYEKVRKLKAYNWSAKGRLGWLAVEKAWYAS